MKKTLIAYFLLFQIVTNAVVQQAAMRVVVAGAGVIQQVITNPEQVVRSGVQAVDKVIAAKKVCNEAANKIANELPKFRLENIDREMRNAVYRHYGVRQ